MEKIWYMKCPQKCRGTVSFMKTGTVKTGTVKTGTVKTGTVKTMLYLRV